MNNVLSNKQLIFIKNYLDGKSGTQAALIAYDTKNPKVAAQISYENLRKPDVKEAIKRALHSKGLTMDIIVENICKLADATPDRISAETSLKANIELLKLSARYNDHS